MRFGNLKNKDLFNDEAKLKKFEEFLKENEIERIDKTDDVCKADKGYHIYDIPRQVVASNEKTYDLMLSFFMDNQPEGNWSLAYC